MFPPPDEETGSRHLGSEEFKKRNNANTGSQIFLKEPRDARKSSDSEKEETTYTWEIDFAELNIFEVIGNGQFGQVYRGDWLNTEIAVKVPKQNIANAEMSLFLREVKLMSSIHHPNIVLFLGACLTKPNVVLVMEYLSGGNVFDFINREENKNMVTSNPAENEVLMMKFAVDCARGMKYLHHRARIIQKDLKTRNLLLDHVLTVKICDFGLSKQEGKSNSGGGNKEGGATPYTVAPEIIRNEGASFKADVFSFAICLWELFHNDLPHKGMAGPELAYAVAHKKLRPKIKNELKGSDKAGLMRRCWAENPDERPDFSQILAELLEMQKALMGDDSEPRISEGRERESVGSVVGRGSSMIYGHSPGGSIGSIGPPGFGSLSTFPPMSPLADYILGTAGPKHVFFGPRKGLTTEENDAHDAERLAQMKKSGGRSSSLGGGSTAPLVLLQEMPKRKGSSVDYGVGCLIINEESMGERTADGSVGSKGESGSEGSSKAGAQQTPMWGKNKVVPVGSDSNV